MATWLRHNLATCHPANIAKVRTDLAAAEEAQGKTLFQVIREIIAQNGHVHAILR
jgi:hypothetical protein